MKKNLIFAIALVAVTVLLGMLKKTGITAHIILSVIGLLLLVVYAVTTKKSWKSPVLEIIERVFFAVALITGIVIMNSPTIAVAAMVHKISAVLFAFFLVITEIQKAIKK